MRKMAAAIGLAVVAACSGDKQSNAATDSLVSVDSTKSNGEVSAPASVAARRPILFAGTSLTAGLGLEPDSAYPMLIQRMIDSAGLPFEVTNAGVSGETSSGFLDRLDWLLRGEFDVLVVETGANDGLRGIPPTTLRRNLTAAIDRIKAKRPSARLVLVQMEALPNLGPGYASEFHAVYPSIAKEKNVELLPFLLQDVAGHRDLNQADGIHPNYKGERMVADNVWRGLRPVLESIAAQTPR